MSRVCLLYLIVFIINAGTNPYIRLPCSSVSQLLITRCIYIIQLDIIISIFDLLTRSSIFSKKNNGRRAIRMKNLPDLNFSMEKCWETLCQRNRMSLVHVIMAGAMCLASRASGTAPTTTLSCTWILHKGAYRHFYSSTEIESIRARATRPPRRSN